MNLQPLTKPPTMTREEWIDRIARAFPEHEDAIHTEASEHPHRIPALSYDLRFEGIDSSDRADPRVRYRVGFVHLEWGT